MRTITGTVQAFLTNEWQSTKQLLSASPEEALSTIGYYKEPILNWTRCGSATITVTLDDDDQVIGNMVETLKAEKTRLQAETQMKLTQIEERIQSLLALPAPSDVPI